MNQSISLSAFEFEVWIDSKTDDRKAPEGRMMINLRRPDDVKGLRYVSFIMYEKELQEFAARQWNNTMEDGYHRLNISGDRVMFYNLELPNAWEGEMTMPYLAVFWPDTARKALLKMVRNIWAKLKVNWNAEDSYENYKLPRVRFSFTDEQAERLTTRYGHGTGKVDVQVHESVRERYAADLQDGNFAERIERLMTIARNTTNAHWQVASVHLFKDADGYYFNILTYWAKRSMNGAVVNHNRDATKAPDWSIHT